jgi:hypothetical protein
MMEERRGCMHIQRYLINGVFSQRADITTGHNGIVEPRTLRQLASDHRFTCSWRTMKKHMSERNLSIVIDMSDMI